MAAGRGGGGASPVGSNHPALACASAPLLIQGGEYCRSLMSLCLAKAA